MVEDIDYKAQLNGSVTPMDATNAAANATEVANTVKTANVTEVANAVEVANKMETAIVAEVANAAEEPREDYVKQKISLENARPGSTKGGAPGTLPGRPGALAYLRRHEQLERSPSSTDIIAAKNSNELKKKYLFNYGGSMGGGITGGLAQKSASVTNLDSRMRSFVDTISEAQKLLNPAPQPSVPMQV